MLNKQDTCDLSKGIKYITVMIVNVLFTICLILLCYIIYIYIMYIYIRLYIHYLDCKSGNQRMDKYSTFQ